MDASQKDNIHKTLSNEAMRSLTSEANATRPGTTDVIELASLDNTTTLLLLESALTEQKIFYKYCLDSGVQLPEEMCRSWE